MGRTITLSTRDDSFLQSAVTNNGEITVLALAGNDTIRMDRQGNLGGNVSVAAGTGNDTVILDTEFGNRVDLGDGNDTFLGLGFGSFATDPFDEVLAGAGDDFIAVSTFQSHYFGGTGNDRFFSEGWQNEFFGGSGRDSIDFLPREDGVNGGTGIGVDLAAQTAVTGTSRTERLVSIEDVAGTQSGDEIFGNTASNKLAGRNGNDLLDGDAGTDTLTGGRGADTLTGGLGTDTFRMDSILDRRDFITDFGSVTGDNDRFLFRAAGFGGGLDAGTLSAAQFQTRADNLAQDASDRFIFRTTDRSLWFDVDGAGGLGPLMVADLQAGAVVTAGDILLF